ncbi:MAG: anti-sigma factor [Steroidobacteraceae bacterium]
MNALPENEQLLDLLAKHATQGLDPVEAEELNTLLRAHPGTNATEFDASVAAILLAGKAGQVAMPAELAATILAAAPVKTHKIVSFTTRPRRQSTRYTAAGWWSAAACLLLAITGWWPRLMNKSVAPPVSTALTIEQQRDALANSGAAIQAVWSPGNEAASEVLMGDVVFDPVTQQGYLRFRGIPANDPRLEQYQLWIADAARKPPQPVDGGVFNTPQATEAGDVIVPFTAKLPVGKPAAFVVTIEQPGGVVVSSQQRVLAVAKVSF